MGFSVLERSCLKWLNRRLVKTKANSLKTHVQEFFFSKVATRTNFLACSVTKKSNPL